MSKTFRTTFFLRKNERQNDRDAPVPPPRAPASRAARTRARRRSRRRDVERPEGPRSGRASPRRRALLRPSRLIVGSTKASSDDRTNLSSSQMYRYWPFRARTRSSSEAAPRGRLEEESDTLGVRGVAARREGVTGSTPAGPAASATPAGGVGTRPGDARASASRAGPPRAPSTGAVRELTISVESATLEDEDESPSGRTSSLRPDAYGSMLRTPSSPAVAPPAQPGVAFQETPVFAAQAVLIKRERSGEASRVKRTNSMLSRSIGRDGKESPSLTRSHSWNARLGQLDSGSSDDDGSPGSESPRRAPRR